MGTRFDNDVYVAGNLASRTFTAPSGSITAANIVAGAAIEATKLQHQHSISVELAEAATAIVAIDKLLYICRGATGTLVQVEAAIVVQATGGDRTVTVDLKKSTGGGAFATVLSATINITNATTILVPVQGTISSTGLVDGDILEAHVTVAGAAGNQAKGLILTLTLREDAS